MVLSIPIREKVLISASVEMLVQETTMEDVMDSLVAQDRTIELQKGWNFPSRRKYRLAEEKMATWGTERSRGGHQVRGW